MVIINSPSNPTGGVVDPEEFERILAVCKKHNIWLMGDECYSHFVYEPHKPFSIASAQDSKENVIIIGSVSKTFAMTGWRIGYTLAPEALIQAMIKIQSQSTSNPTSIAQYAALEAMRGTMDTVPPMLAEYAKRRKRIVEGLARDSGRDLRMARRRVLRVPEYFRASRRWQERAGEELHGACQSCCSKKRTSRWFPAKLRRAGIPAVVVCHVHRAHRRGSAPAGKVSFSR